MVAGATVVGALVVVAARVVTGTAVVRVVGIVVGVEVTGADVVSPFITEQEHGWFPPWQTGGLLEILQYPVPLSFTQYASALHVPDKLVVRVKVLRTDFVVTGAVVEVITLEVVVVTVDAALVPGAVVGLAVEELHKHGWLPPRQIGGLVQVLQ